MSKRYMKGSRSLTCSFALKCKMGHLHTVRTEDEWIYCKVGSAGFWYG